jgi:hypothetical protein
MGLVGVSEYTFMGFFAVREPYVRRLLIKRSAWTLMLTFAIGPLTPPKPNVPSLLTDADVVVALVCLYTFVPGKRL